MIHDFATTPRQTDWRANKGGVEFKSNEKNNENSRAKSNKGILLVILAAAVLLLFVQKVVLSVDPILDQQPDQAAKKEYAESILYVEEAEETVAFDDPVDSEPPVVIEAAIEMPVPAKPKPISVVKKAKPVIAAVAPVPSDPDYEFYDYLKEDSWPVPVNKGTYVDGDLANRVKPIYKLQAASFRNQSDAYRLVAKLNKRKLRALVVESVSTNGEFWYQVSVGPFVNTSKMNKAQDILVSLGMMPLKKRVN